MSALAPEVSVFDLTAGDDEGGIIAYAAVPFRMEAASSEEAAALGKEIATRCLEIIEEHGNARMVDGREALQALEIVYQAIVADIQAKAARHARDQ